MQNAKNSYCKKQWTIFIRKQWTILINAQNRFYECSKQIRIYGKHDVQWANFINVETDFICRDKGPKLYSGPWALTDDFDWSEDKYTIVRVLSLESHK